ncbi:MAG TPA: hypothetical protein VK589_06280, partial [Chryseolinea sp.]|nr:hypothetical protein [Chryseolinea sp.]
MNRIKNYNDLVAHRTRLEANLRGQKVYLNAKVAQIKEKFEPFNKIISFFNGEKNGRGKLLLQTGSSLLKIGSSAGIDMLLQKKIAKAGWLTKLILPFV